MKIKILQNRYNKVVDDYIQLFSNKQEIEFEFWVGDVVGGIASFGDIYFFSFSDILYDINTNQPKELILQWLYDGVDYPDININYYSYSKGLRHLQLQNNNKLKD